jgi:hypothetical protein
VSRPAAAAPARADGFLPALGLTVVTAVIMSVMIAVMPGLVTLAGFTMALPARQDPPHHD